jgi:citronellyl-CoA synthetase
VADALDALPDVEISVVYGVEIPGAEGRAGMAALRLAPGAAFDGERLYARVEQALPAWARPAFVRLIEAPDLTATFKVRKHALQREGFDPKLIPDALFYRDDARRAYLPLSPDAADAIRAGRVRL